MIVRILGEGQFRVDEDAAERLTALDSELDAAVDSDDEAAFETALGTAVRVVRESGSRVSGDDYVTSDYILPFSDATVAEVRKLLADGTIPGDSIGLP